MADLSVEERKAVGLRIDAARKRQKLSYVELGHRTGYDERTIRNAVTGRSARLTTLREICEALKIDLDGDRSPQASATADEAHGAYTLAQYADHVGVYNLYHRSFTVRGAISKTQLEIAWSKERNCLAFTHHHAATHKFAGSHDHMEVGDIFIGQRTGLIHFSHSRNGSLGLMIVTRMRLEDKTMHGVILTSSEQAFYHKPSVSAVLLQKREDGTPDLPAQMTSIPHQHEEFAYLNDYLLEIERGLGVFAIGMWGIERRSGADRTESAAASRPSDGTPPS
jgi:transcriptional regulator with XRE-family HTH domain